MNSNHGQKKHTLGAMKGKSVTSSGLVIRYHASDDELEELYPNSDEEEQTPESEKSPSKSTFSKCQKSKINDSEASVDANSEGIASDPWRILSDFKGKITKTLEGRLSEIKSEKKERKKRESNSSVSDYENADDVTPVEESIDETLGRELPSSIVRKRIHSPEFAGFYKIKTGLKTDDSEDKEIESGVEAAEVFEGMQKCDSTLPRDESRIESCVLKTVSVIKELYLHIFRASDSKSKEADEIRTKISNSLFCNLFISLFVLLCLYLVPISHLKKGFCLGFSISLIFRQISSKINELLDTKSPIKAQSSVIEIPAVEEHSVHERFEGWLNELPYDYQPDNYHVARTKAVYFTLEGEVLQVMETQSRIPKRAIWDEPDHKAKFTKRRVYSLTGSTVELLPVGLIRRRRWSKKYPICIILSKNALIGTTLLNNNSDDEIQQTEHENSNMNVEGDETDDDSSQSKDIRDVFEESQEDFGDVRHKIFIFARTDRQKEDWFRRLSRSASYGSRRSSISVRDTFSSLNSSPTIMINESKSSTSSNSFFEVITESPYNHYMAQYTESQATTSVETDKSLASDDKTWVNALLGRLIFDMHKCPETISVIQDKIQRKLSNIKVPYFMESLLVSELVIGQGAPIVHNSTKPVLNERGLWFDLDISYEGCLTMTIETRLNLMKLKRASFLPNKPNCNAVSNEETRPARSPIFDSDVEDSPETSTEDEDSTQRLHSPSKEATSTQSSGKKFLSMMDKLAASKYFQSATELSYVKRAMEGVSNTDIRLMVSVSSIQGCLSVNIPPSPADRLWYGFKPLPKICLTAKPAVGEKTFNIVFVTKWIETKLLREFQKVVVIPNMDDLVLPFCPNYPYDS